MLRGPTAFYTIATELVAAVDEDLATALGGRPEKACVVPGEIAWDSCDCGMLVVTVNRWSLSDSFPDDTTARGAFRTGPCDMPWIVADMELQLVRCAPSPTGTVIDVPCPRLDAAAEQLISDAYITMTSTVSLLCGMRNDERIVDYSIGDQSTIGPSGGCVGLSLSLSVAVDR